MKAMIEDLREFELEEIQKTFLWWRREHSKIPTPADIRNQILKKRREDNYYSSLGVQSDLGEDVGDYHTLSDEQKADFEEFMSKYRRKP